MGFVDFLCAVFAYYTFIISIVMLSSIQNIFCLIRDHYRCSDEVTQTNPLNRPVHHTQRRMRIRSPMQYRLMYSPTICKKNCTESDVIQFTHENHLCSICLEVHLMNDCIQTVCGHIYGQSCFQKWIKHNILHTTNKYTHCPNCKQSVTSITKYLFG
jgi:hypothetical protein